jgi:F-type H+-transporting ATPase subunit epsilon
MAATYPLKIVSPDKIEFEADVESVTAPGIMGSLGILAHHAPLLTTLDKGKIRVKESPQTIHNFLVDGGILEVSGGGAVILADQIESA